MVYLSDVERNIYGIAAYQDSFFGSSVRKANFIKHIRVVLGCIRDNNI